MDRKEELEQALASRDYRRLIELLEPETADTLGPLVRTLRFARNMLALRERDAALAGMVETAPTTGRVRIATADDGNETLVPTGSAGNAFCPTGTPTRETRRAAGLLEEFKARDVSVLLTGVGDGHALGTLAAEQPDDLGAERAVFVVEPDAEVFRSALMLHDWSGPEGAIRRGRFFFVVGEGWAKRLEEIFRPEAQMAPPRATMAFGPRHAGIVDVVNRISDSLSAAADHLKKQVFERYGRAGTGEIPGRLTQQGSRVLLITTVFSTVLQHSTRHLAEGFRRGGCETEVVIESNPWRQHTVPSILSVIDRFRPDMIIQINHHRHENQGLIPDAIPFVCIIQDNLNNLLDEHAGAAMGCTDFAAGSWVRRYALEHGYPPGRCIEIPRLARAPETPAVHVGGGADILYVSNHSATPERAVEIAAAPLDESQPEAARIVRLCGEDLINHYSRGGVIEDSIDLDTFVAEACERHGFTNLRPDTLSILGDRLGVTVNNALYRRQGLRWVVRAAEALSLRVVLHGKGWEDNPEFGTHAGGVISYSDLPEATSKARFCMVLEPYFPTQHQRALDTWMWGGLPLIRRRERDAQQQAFNRWLERLGPDVASLEDALAALGDDPGEFKNIYMKQLGLHAWDGRGDLVTLRRERERHGIGYLNVHPPLYEDISFSGEDDLARVMHTLIEDPDRYAKIQQAQHDWGRPRFSYELGARRLLEQVAAGLKRA